MLHYLIKIVLYLPNIRRKKDEDHTIVTGIIYDNMNCDLGYDTWPNVRLDFINGHYELYILFLP